MGGELTWVKSSYSQGQEHQTCVEVALTSQVTAVRDSKARGGGQLVLRQRSWSALLDELRGSAE